MILTFMCVHCVYAQCSHCTANGDCERSRNIHKQKNFNHYVHLLFVHVHVYAHKRVHPHVFIFRSSAYRVGAILKDWAQRVFYFDEFHAFYALFFAPWNVIKKRTIFMRNDKWFPVAHEIDKWNSLFPVIGDQREIGTRGYGEEIHVKWMQ